MNERAQPSVIATIATLLLVLGHFSSHAQTQVKVVDRLSNEALPGSYIQVIKEGNIVNTLISNDAGVTLIEGVTVPFALNIKHIGYNNLKKQIDSQGTHIIALKEVSTLMENVVVTGQYSPQSAKNSVYQVKTVGADRFEAQGANSIQDVLSNELNIRFTRDNAIGTSGIFLQGLSGQYVKVLLDGIPMTGRSGVTNEIDLGQIDVQTIQRVEIVQGPMSVNYGADALAGVINIITKKDISSKVDLDISLFEESVGNEYSWFKDGIHSPSIKVGYKVSEKWYTQLNTRINKFGGWKGNSEGRQKEWYPKTQNFIGFLTRYTVGDFNIHYRVDILDETLQNFGAINDNNLLKDPFAIDEEYIAKRWTHQLQSDWKIGSANLNSSLSYTDYKRNTHQFSRNLITDGITTTVDSEQDVIFYRTLFFRETLSNVLSGNWRSIQFGIDGTNETAGGTTLNSGDKHLTDLGFFASAELVKGGLKVRPGVRLTYNSIFNTTPTPAVNFSYSFNKNTQLRWSYARGFRAPSIRELYHEFIDSNHNIVGNSNLKPEYSHSFNVGLSQKLKTLPLEWNLSGFYNHLDNMITFFFPAETNQPTTYTNLLKYKTTGINLTGEYHWEELQVQAGFSHIGLYQRLSNESDVPAFVFSSEFNAQVLYQPKNLAGIKTALFYKFIGASKRYQLDDDDRPVLNRTDNYNFLDATISKSFRHGVTISLGSRNILDVTSVNSTLSGGTHSGNNGQRAISYGRSYFFKINYHFKQ